MEMISSNKVHPSISRVSRTDMKYAISYYRTGCMPTDCDQQRCKSWLNSWLNSWFNEKNDISSLLKWAETWQMRFNSKKCHILSISHQRNKSSPVYYLGTEVLTSVSSHTYLGIREGHGNGNENQSRSVPFHWFHSRPVPAGCSENVNHSRPVLWISKPFLPVPFHQYCWTNRPISK